MAEWLGTSPQEMEKSKAIKVTKVTANELTLYSYIVRCCVGNQSNLLQDETLVRIQLGAPGLYINHEKICDL